MSYRPREIAIRAREAAAFVLRTLERERLVERFLHSYATEFNRPGRTAQPARFRELLETIGREALLAMVTWVDHEAPRRLGVRRGPRQRGQPDTSLHLFREEFLAGLRQALSWTPGELEMFRHDLDLYKRLDAGESRPPRARRASNVVGGPFVDRCGIILDPAMLDKARRAAGKFETQLRAITEEILKKVFSRRREN
jgi:hypothetical protein